MCVKEFLGYTCGHCAVPYLRQCPLAAQNELFPYCKFPADRPIHVPEMCHPCSRVVWNKKVLEEEEQHKRAHEARLCACEVIFDEEERVRRKGDRGKEAKGAVDGRRAVGVELASGLGELPCLGHGHADQGNGHLGYRILGELSANSNVRDVSRHANDSGHGMAWYPGEVQYDSIAHRKAIPTKQQGDPSTAKLLVPKIQQDAKYNGSNFDAVLDREQALSTVFEHHLAVDEAMMISCDDTQSTLDLEIANLQKPMTVSGDILLQDTQRPPTPPTRTASAPT